MLEALISGDRDPAALADLAKRRLRNKIPELTEALAGRFNEHHAFLARVHLDLIDQHTSAIEELTARIEVVIEPFQSFHDRRRARTIADQARSDLLAASIEAVTAHRTAMTSGSPATSTRAA